MEIIKKLDKEFEEKFPMLLTTEAAFGQLSPVYKDLKEFNHHAYAEILKGLEARLPKEKEQLDKNDPDNYGACYAIGGFNSCLQETQALIQEYLKEIC